MKYKKLLKLLFLASLIGTGLVFWFQILHYRYAGLIFLGIAAVIGIYWILDYVASRHPKKARWLRRCFTLLLCLSLLVMAVTQILIVTGSKGEQDAECDYVLVLGAAVNGTTPSRALRERLEAAYQYLVTYPKAQCIVSGGMGRGENITEALCMFQWLIDKGIEPHRIWLEDRATSTMENISFSLALIEQQTGTRPQNLAIVSSEYHLFRAGLMAQDQGVSMIGVPARTEPVFSRAHYYFREIFGVWFYILFGN